MSPFLHLRHIASFAGHSCRGCAPLPHLWQPLDGGLAITGMAGNFLLGVAASLHPEKCPPFLVASVENLAVVSLPRIGGLIALPYRGQDLVLAVDALTEQGPGF